MTPVVQQPAALKRKSRVNSLGSTGLVSNMDFAP